MRLDTRRLQTLDQVREFLAGSRPLDLQPQTRAEAYGFVAETLERSILPAGKADKGPAIHVDAPNVDIAARLALSHHIGSRPSPPPAGTSFGLVVITPPPNGPNVPHGNRGALTAVAAGGSSPPPGEPRQRPAAGCGHRRTGRKRRTGRTTPARAGS